MKMAGKQSVTFPEAPFILGEAAVVGEKEGKGPFGSYFHEICTDPMFGEQTWEAAESELISRACRLALANAGMKKNDLNYVIGGDLLAQLMATAFGVQELQVPFFGIYGACSTMGEALALASMMIDGGYAESVLAVTSSHFAGAEKQFRFPLGYGAQRPASASWTVTGSGAVVLVNEAYMHQGGVAPGGRVRITGMTTGKITNYGIQDSMNMGAAMAPAAADTVLANFQDFDRSEQDYDLIVTGDLGYVGGRIFCEILKERGYDVKRRYLDCGMAIYDRNLQDTHAGGSGCGCSAVTLTGYLLKRMREGHLGRILFVPTGALLSPVSFHEDMDIPGIAYGIVMEHIGF